MFALSVHDFRGDRVLKQQLIFYCVLNRETGSLFLFENFPSLVPEARLSDPSSCVN
jgi:hypothetical protein